METTEGDQTAVSAEFLQNLQSAVGSSGVIGQVQVIETENGPMTVIFMEEGTETSTETTTVDGLDGQVSTQVPTGGEQLQYQFVQDGENYTAQILDTGQQVVTSDGQIISSDGQIITSDGQVIAATDQVITSDGQVIAGMDQVITSDGQVISTTDQVITSDGVITTSDGVSVGGDVSRTLNDVPSSQQTLISTPVSEQVSEAAGATQDTYYITETGEIVKIESSTLNDNQIQQPGITDTQIPKQQQTVVQMVDAVESTLIPSTVATVGTKSAIVQQQPEFTAVKLTDMFASEIVKTSSPKQPQMRSLVAQAKYPQQISKATVPQTGYTHKIVDQYSSVKGRSTASSQTKVEDYGSYIVKTTGNQTVVYPADSDTVSMKQTVVYPKLTKTPAATAKNIHKKQAIAPKNTFVSQPYSQPVGKKATSVIKSKSTVSQTASSNVSQKLLEQSYLGSQLVKQQLLKPTLQSIPGTKSTYQIAVNNPLAGRSNQIAVNNPLAGRGTTLKYTTVQKEASSSVKPMVMKQRSEEVAKPPVATIMTNQFISKPSDKINNQQTVIIPQILAKQPNESKQGKLVINEPADLLSSVLHEAQMELSDNDASNGSSVESNLIVEEKADLPTITKAEEEALTETLAEFLACPEAMETDEGSTAMETTEKMVDAEVREMTDPKTIELQTAPAIEKPIEVPETSKVTSQVTEAARVLATSPQQDKGTDQGQDSEASNSAKPETTPESPSKASQMKSIDVPDSDVTIQLYADGTLVTKDRSGTNYSQVKLEDLGLDQDMLSGNTDIELLIVQGDGKEVRATLNTNILGAHEKDEVPTEDVSVENGSASMSPVKSPMKSPIKTDSVGTSTANELRPYKCSMCPRTFKFYRTFRCHEIVHTKSEIFTCHLCKRVFARETNLASHLELHQKKAAMGISEVRDRMKDKRSRSENERSKSTWKCEKCDNVYNDYLKLKQHVKSAHNKAKHEVCQYCDKTFSTVNLLQKHSLVHLGPFACCDVSYSERSEYIKHLEDKHPQKLFTCASCDKVTINKSDYTSHVRFFHENESVEVKESLLSAIYDSECSICGKKMNKSALNRHMTDVHGDDDLKCLYCDFSCNMDFKLKRHLKIKHGLTIAEKCDHCSKEFSGEKAIVEHAKFEHMGPYPCAKCSSTFNNRSDLERHLFEGHEGGFLCRKCDQKFMYSGELKQHVADHEPGSQTFLCDYCGSAFEIKPQLKSHIVKEHFKGDYREMVKTHPDMKQVPAAHICQICGEYDFDSRMCYARHMRDSHFSGNFEAVAKVFPNMKKFPEPVDPVKCDTCGKEFSHMTRLNMHVRTHAIVKKTKRRESFDSSDDEDDEKVDLNNIQPRDSEKEYHCEKCDQSFSRKAALDKHMSALHEENGIKEALKEMEKEEKERASMELENKVNENIVMETELSKSPRRKSSQMHICKICEEIYKTKEELKKHQESHRDSAEPMDEDTLGQYSEEDAEKYDIGKKMCKICPKHFSSTKNTKRHMKQVHKIYFPPGVAYSMLGAKSGAPMLGAKSDVLMLRAKSDDHEMPVLKLEVEIADPIEKDLLDKQVYECTLCSKKFDEETNLSRHMIMKHKVKGTLKVKLKSGKTGSKSNFKKSKASKVKEETIENDISVVTDMDTTADESELDSTNDITTFLGRNFNLEKKNSPCSIESVKKKVHKCNICGLNFSRDATLKKHQAFHDGEDSSMDVDDSNLQLAMYGCQTCGNMYSTPGGLIYHTRTKHSEVDEELVLNHIEEIDKNLRAGEPSKMGKIEKIEKPMTPKSRKRKLSLSGDDDVHLQAKKREKLDTQGHKSFTCLYCPAVYKTFQGVMTHEKESHPSKLKSPEPTPQSSEVKQYSLSGRKIKKSAKRNEQMQCDKCNKYFDMEASLKRHIIMAHGNKISLASSEGKLKTDADNSYECTLCHMTFDRGAKLNKHMVMKHKEKSESAVKVKKEYLETDFQSSTMIYECDVCNEKFSVLSALRHHMISVHDEDDEADSIKKSETLSCDICHEEFATQNILNNHMKKHLGGDKQLKCSVCQDKFISKNKLEMHLKKNHQKEWSKKVKCKICLSLFDTERGMKKHKLNHRQTIEENADVGPAQHKCTHCDKVFKWQKNLVSHVKCFHENVSTKTCGVCNKVFPNDKMIAQHMKMHEKTYDCDICGKGFAKEPGLRMHEIIVHKIKKTDTEALFSCNVCQRNFTSQTTLLQHMLSHTSMMPFKCSKCALSFKQEQELKSHQCEKSQLKKKTVTGKKPILPKETDLKFSCKRCGKKFSKLSLVNAHRAEAHKGVYMGFRLAKKKKEKLISIIRTRRQSSASSTDSKEGDKKMLHQKKILTTKTALREKAKVTSKLTKIISTRSSTTEDPSTIKKRKLSVPVRAASPRISGRRLSSTDSIKSSPKVTDNKATPKGADTKSTAKGIDDKATPKWTDTKSTPKAAVGKSTPKGNDSKSAPKGNDSKSTTKGTAKGADTKSVAKGIDDKGTPKGTDTKSTPKATVSKSVPKGNDSKSTPKGNDSKATPKFNLSKVTPRSTPKTTPKLLLKLTSSKIPTKSTPKSAKSSPKTPQDDKSTPKTVTKTKSASKMPVPCPLCRKILSKRFTLRAHLRKVHHVDPDTLESMQTKRVKCLYCSECAKMFWSQSLYDEHIKQKHPDKAALELDKEVLQHLIKTELLSPKPGDGQIKKDEDSQMFDAVQHKCEFCGSVFGVKTEFDKHIAKYHPDHIAEYGINLDVLSMSKPEIELVDDRLDPTNFLNVEVYQNITCQKLASSAVVMIEKISDNFNVSETCIKSENELEDEKPSPSASMEKEIDTTQIGEETKGESAINKDSVGADSVLETKVSDPANTTENNSLGKSPSAYEEMDTEELEEKLLRNDISNTESASEEMDTEELPLSGKSDTKINEQTSNEEDETVAVSLEGDSQVDILPSANITDNATEENMKEIDGLTEQEKEVVETGEKNIECDEVSEDILSEDSDLNGESSSELKEVVKDTTDFDEIQKQAMATEMEYESRSPGASRESEEDIEQFDKDDMDEIGMLDNSMCEANNDELLNSKSGLDSDKTIEETLVNGAGTSNELTESVSDTAGISNEAINNEHESSDTEESEVESIDDKMQETLRDTENIDDKMQETLRDTENIDDKMQETLRDTENIDDKMQETLRDTENIDDKMQETLRDTENIDDKIQETFGGTENIDDKIQETFGDTENITDEIQETFEDAENIVDKIQETSGDTENIDDKIQETFDDTENIVDQIQETSGDTENIDDEVKETFGESELVTKDNVDTVNINLPRENLEGENSVSEQSIVEHESTVEAEFASIEGDINVQTDNGSSTVGETCSNEQMPSCEISEIDQTDRLIENEKVLTEVTENEQMTSRAESVNDSPVEQNYEVENKDVVDEKSTYITDHVNSKSTEIASSLDVNGEIEPVSHSSYAETIAPKTPILESEQTLSAPGNTLVSYPESDEDL